jgi:hypothetical protein
MTLPTNAAFLKLSKRAETSARETLMQTFVDVGPLFTLLSSPDHQILFGRRGTGKTHALSYLADAREKAGDVVVLVDLRNIGSNAGLYGDASRPLQERATGLLIDVLTEIHEALYRHFVTHEDGVDLAEAGPALDAVADAITQVRVVGDVELESNAASTSRQSAKTSASLGLGKEGPIAEVSADHELDQSGSHSRSERRRGREHLYVNFGSTGAAFRRLASLLKSRRFWLLLDEWSSVPVVLQPYLADLLRRSLFPITGMTIKIAAIEQRSEFQIRSEKGDYVGIEVGADASADISLDDFMVFDNDEERAKAFFRNLITRHAAAITTGSELETEVPKDGADLVRQAFTEKRAFEEFVRAAEGVPRDAINILALAAQRALGEPISVQHVRVAAKNWYQRDKDNTVAANERARDLLHWIIDTVIGERRARAFLLRSDAGDDLIDALYDARVLHVLKRSVSTHDQPGVRYDVYKMDYGCYVDLIATAKAPQGLLPFDDETSGTTMKYIDVPPDDYRSIRRAILSLERFHTRAGG